MRIRAVAVCLTLTVLHGRAQGQEVWGSIRGRVGDDRGAPVAAAQVQISSVDLLGTRTVVTDRAGHYHVQALPPGTYTVRITRLGKRPVTIERVPVQLGRTSALPWTPMETSATRLDEVRIAANRFSIDPMSAATAVALTPEDYAVLPSARDYRLLIDILPNTVQSERGDAANVNGATGLENAYFIDGVNVTEQLKAQWATSLPSNFVKAVEVKSGGYEAQHGRALGAVVNAVTYSGTNDFSVNVFGFTNHSGLSAKSRVLPAFRETNPMSYDLGVRLGGPIFRDRLWYSAAYNPRIWHVDRELIGLGVFRDDHLMHVFAAKLSLHTNAATNVELSVFGDPATHRLVTGPRRLTATTVDPLLVRFEAGQVVATLRGTMILRRLLLEASAARSTGKLNSVGDSDVGQSAPQFIDYGANTMEGGIGFWSRADLGRSAFVLKATMTFGSHTTVIGAEYEDVSAFRNLGCTGGYRVETNGLGLYTASCEGGPGRFHSRVPTAYVQNSWRVADGLTINTGVRWSEQTLSAASGRTAQRFPNEWQPRVGIVWQPSTSRSDRVFASYGRFYQQVPLNLSTLWYLSYPFGVAYYSSDPRQPGAVADSAFDFTGPEPVNLMNRRGLEVENSDEMSVGYERLIGRSFRLTARAVWRDLRSSFQWGFDPATNTSYLGTPGRSDFPILPKPVREYRALELGAEGRWREHSYRASYMLSRSRGNYPGLYNSDEGYANPGGIGTFIFPAHAVNSTGLLPNDRTHVFKLSGSQRTRFGLTTGVFVTVESGAPLNVFGFTWYNLPSFIEPRGSAGRTPWLWDANLRFAQELPGGTRRRARVLLDLLHVGNPQRPVRLDEFKYEPQIGGAPLIPNPNYRKPLAYQSPMQVRLGIDADF